MLDIFKKPETKRHVNPRFRAYGKARIDIATRATTRDDWERLWKKSTYPFPFSWGKSWKQCVEYKVSDYAAEVGFFIDILGFPVNAFDPDYAMFTSPNGEFFFSVVPAQTREDATPPDAIRLQFMVEDILDTSQELERRGVVFECKPSPITTGSPLMIGSFRTPHGIGIDLWGFNDDAYELEEDENPSLWDQTTLDGNQPDDAQEDVLPAHKFIAASFEDTDRQDWDDDEAEDLNTNGESLDVEYIFEDDL